MENIIKFYEWYDEEGRLSRDKAHMVEYLVTVRYFDRLFKTGSRILDVCAGAGRYSFYLAEKGHAVTACDLVEHNVDIIKSNPKANILNDILVCNALDLSQFNENSFDIVLCMGALYHVNSNDLKEKVISESARVCKSGGIVVLSYLSANKNENIIPASRPEFDGIFFNSVPSEIEGMAIKSGLEKLHHISTRSSSHNEDNLNELSDENFLKYMEHLYQKCEDEDATNGLTLWIGRQTNKTPQACLK